MSGHGEASLESLIQHELLGWLFPDTANSDSTFAPKLVQLALASTDKRIREGMPVTPAFILAALLWWPFVKEKKRLVDEGSTNLAASHEAALNVIAKQQLFTSIPKRFSGPMRDICNSREWWTTYQEQNPIDPTTVIEAPGSRSRRPRKRRPKRAT